MFCVLKLSCHWIPCTKTVLEYFWRGGGGVSILYHNILTPPHPIKKRNVIILKVLSVICKCFFVLKLSCHWIPCTNTVLEYFFGGGGGGSIYYTIMY